MTTHLALGRVVITLSLMEVTAGRGGRQIDAPRHAPAAAPRGVPHEKADRKSSRFSPKLIRKAGFSSTKSKKTRHFYIRNKNKRTNKLTCTSQNPRSIFVDICSDG
ncbi:hypothetical protein WBO78_08055 [Bosea sp. CCNWLW174]|uniref:hypothetical protein n=1 Tax=unclassified Bosea (in: a-proteobacteria) TaxID=2653178 RepID=UPI0030143F8F